MVSQDIINNMQPEADTEHQKDRHYWWPYKESTKPDYRLTMDRVEEIRRINDWPVCYRAWGSFCDDAATTLKVRMRCSNCNNMHAMKGESAAKTECKRLFEWIKMAWAGCGTIRMHPEYLWEGRVDEGLLRGFEDALRKVEREYLKEAQGTACRRAFGQQGVGWVPWVDTDGEDRLR